MISRGLEIQASKSEQYAEEASHLGLEWTTNVVISIKYVLMRVDVF